MRGAAVLGLDGRTAIVTGGAQGIGRSIVLRLAKAGCKVAIFDRAKEQARETMALCGDASVDFHDVDVTDYGAIERATGAVEAQFGPVWLLVNNAGWDRPGRFIDSDRTVWDKIVQINLYGALNMHAVVCQRMVKSGGGRVVNIASEAGRVGTTNEAVYSACKGGIIAFTKSMARELAQHDILVNAVSPGIMNTSMLRNIAAEMPDGIKWRDAMVRLTPLRRIGEPDDCAGIVAFLGSDEARFITGQTISVSGGMVMA
jgi:2-hydroxycyclohexanecarboxyl-CoA dehydrogenase